MTLVGNFDANGDSEVIENVNGFSYVLGNDTNGNFGGGTVSIKVRQSPNVDWTTLRDVTQSSPNNEKVDATIEYPYTFDVKLTMSGSTNANLDYTINNN